MERTVRVIIDASSWRSRRPPTRLARCAGDRTVNVHSALLYTALCTRPPVWKGFHLSDYWAWLRYSSAIAPISNDDDGLRLHADWRTVDPHQKTILSDDLGIGFTTQFIGDVFSCSEFVDTLYFIDVLDPGAFRLRRRRRRIGPDKSPDYIARYSGRNYLVLECKGTQSSRTVLQRAMDQGRRQKAALRSHRRKIRHSIVAGLFIPQWESSENACVRVVDPTWKQFDRFLTKHTNEKIDQAITQISLAKQFALCGLTEVPNYLSQTPVGSAARMHNLAIAELRALAAGTGASFVIDSDQPGRATTKRDERPPFRFRATAPLALIERLLEAPNVSEVVADLALNKPVGLSAAGEGQQASLKTTLGFLFELVSHIPTVTTTPRSGT